MSNNIHQLGISQKNLESITETAEYLDSILNHIENNSGITNGDEYTLGFLFSSRGSFPFLEAMDFVSRNLRSNLTLRAIPHIFSLENLVEIISNYDTVKYSLYQPIISNIYDNIATEMTRKVKKNAKNTSNFVLSDWDEVCTGSNISERIKIYNRMKIPKKIPFNIISFISEGRRRLDSTNVKSFKRNFKKSPTNYSTYDILMKNPIEWSDDEVFYSKLGLEYPGIAVPDFKYLGHFIRKEALPIFYSSFLLQYGKELSKGASVLYELFRPFVESDSDHLFDEENILISSYMAFENALSVVDRHKGIKDRKLLKAEFEFDYDGGMLLEKKSGRPILNRNMPENRLSEGDYSKYRYPFTLVKKKATLENSFVLEKMLTPLQADISSAFRFKREGFLTSSNIFYVNTKTK